MSENLPAQRHQPWLYAGLALLFFACLWIGWSDFDPVVAQHVIREAIRSVIRWLVQFLVQYAVPFAILVYFAASFRRRKIRI